MKKYSYVGISFVVLIFGIWFFPKIMDRIDQREVRYDTRLDNFNELSYVKLNDVKKESAGFCFLNQDSLYVSNEDFLGKVFVVEFFLRGVLQYVLK